MDPSSPWYHRNALLLPLQQWAFTTSVIVKGMPKVTCELLANPACGIWDSDPSGLPVGKVSEWEWAKSLGSTCRRWQAMRRKKIQVTEPRVALAADGRCLQNSCKRWLSRGIYSGLSVTEASIHLSTFLTFYYLIWLWGFKCSPLQATETPHY